MRLETLFKKVSEGDEVAAAQFMDGFAQEYYPKFYAACTGCGYSVNSASDKASRWLPLIATSLVTQRPEREMSWKDAEEEIIVQFWGALHQEMMTGIRDGIDEEEEVYFKLFSPIYEDKFDEILALAPNRAKQWLKQEQDVVFQRWESILDMWGKLTEASRKLLAGSISGPWRELAIRGPLGVWLAYEFRDNFFNREIYDTRPAAPKPGFVKLYYLVMQVHDARTRRSPGAEGALNILERPNPPSDADAARIIGGGACNVANVHLKSLAELEKDRSTPRWVQAMVEKIHDKENQMPRKRYRSIFSTFFWINEAKGNLTGLQQRVLQAFGSGPPHKDLAGVARSIGVSPETASTLHNAALVSLRAGLARNRIICSLEETIMHVSW